MKKSRLLLGLALISMVTTGCDFLDNLSGGGNHQEEKKDDEKKTTEPESISLNEKIDNDSLELESYLGDNSYNPEHRLFEHVDELDLIHDFSQKLTALEEEVFLLKITGLEYKEISSVLDKDIKVVDNALQRIRIKLKAYLDEKNSNI